MKLKQRISAFIELGEFLSRCDPGCGDVEPFDEFDSLIKTAHQHNGWFTEGNVRHAIGSIAGCLKAENIKKWIANYRDELKDKKFVPLEELGILSTGSLPPSGGAGGGPQYRIGVIMAGNIPLVGFHDMLCILMSGNVFVGKTSSKGDRLLHEVSKILIEIEPSFNKYIEFHEGLLENIDAIIATGSNNTSRYFEYYFGKYPNIIRKNRNSVAVLDGTETPDELRALGKDVFQYFGLGCRNVSKLFVPTGYNFDNFFNAIYEYKNVVDNNKYANNYDYNKAMLMMNRVRLLENGFLLLNEDDALTSPVATLNYEYYPDDKVLMDRLRAERGNTQCIVSKNGHIKGSISFGSTQQPELWDYADGVDTMKFLIELNQ